MNFKFKITLKSIIIFLIMQIYTPCTLASSLPSAARSATKNLTNQVGRQAAKQSLSGITGLSPMAVQTRQLSNSTKIPKYPVSVPKFTSADTESNSDMLKWLAVGGLAVAADLARKDDDVINFENFDANDMPNFKQTVAFFKAGFQDVEIAPDVDIELLAIQLAGRNSYSSLANMINKCKNKAIEHRHRMITEQDIAEIFFDMSIGEVNQRMLEALTRPEALSTAYHEAGHALITALYLRNTNKVKAITIKPRTAFWGHAIGLDMVVFKSPATLFVYRLMHEAQADQMKLIQLLAGGVAEKSATNQPFTKYDFRLFLRLPGLGTDIPDAVVIAEKIAKNMLLVERFISEHNNKLGESDMDSKYYEYELQQKLQGIDDVVDRSQLNKKVYEILENSFQQTVELFKYNRNELDQIAHRLFENGTILGSEVYEIIGEQPPLLDFQYNKIIDDIEKHYEYR